MNEGDDPFAYAVVGDGETLAVVPYKAIADDWAFISKCKVVPLYDRPQPTLTDEERAAVEWAESHFLSDYEQLREPRDKERADTLRGLLERLK